MGYTVAAVDPRAAADALIGLWRRNLDIGDDAADRLRWLYLDSPVEEGQTLILSSGGAAAGCIGISTRALRAAGAPLRAALIGDFAVDRAHRSVLPALSLARAALAHAEQRHDLAYGFPNEAALPVMRRAGFADVGRLTRWVRVLRHASYVRRIIPVGVVASAAGAVLDGVRLARSAGLLLRGPGVLELGHDLDTRSDDLARAAGARLPLVAERGAAFLRWRFLAKPASRCEVATLADRGGGALRAQAIFERDGATAHVRDFLALDEAALGGLLDRLSLALWRRGCASLSLTFLGSLAVADTLAAHGFVAREQGRMLIARGRVPAAGDRDLTEADEDL